MSFSFCFNIQPKANTNDEMYFCISLLLSVNLLAAIGNYEKHADPLLLGYKRVAEIYFRMPQKCLQLQICI